MTYPEGTRLVVWNHDGALARGVAMDSHQLCWDARLAIAQEQIALSVRESAAKCAEMMLAMLIEVEQGRAINWTNLRALIAEAEGKDAK